MKTMVRSSRAVIVTSYLTDSPNGKNLGCPGYSYDFVVRLFAPLLEQWGELTVVAAEDVDRAVAEARLRGREPIHVSFLPLQDVRLAADAPNVVVPAWEFPDIPDHEFDGKPENNWVAMAAKCDSLIVGGPFTRDAFRKAGVQTPIQIVQVPTPDEYFQVPWWTPDRHTLLECPGHGFSWCEPELPSLPSHEGRRQGLKRAVRGGVRALCRDVGRFILRDRLYRTIRVASHFGRCEWRGESAGIRPAAMPVSSESQLDLSGVVYTSIFNPSDSRKNWGDLLTAFLWALRDCEDATLVLKLVANRPEIVNWVWNFCHRSGISHRCRVVFVPTFLSDGQLIELATGTTYYLTTTRAEGNCLPLLNYLAAGRPGISPCHTAISDYFGRDVGFVVESHPEPAAFPHDSQLRKTTTWHRLVWTSLVEEIRRSYEIAKHDRSAYGRLARNAREKMLHWNSNAVVASRLQESLRSVVEPPREEAVKPSDAGTLLQRASVV
ncbi:MAG: hypothetical protein ABFC77_02100 [Thermoguttaceae bacterium]